MALAPLYGIDMVMKRACRGDFSWVACGGQVDGWWMHHDAIIEGKQLSPACRATVAAAETNKTNETPHRSLVRSRQLGICFFLLAPVVMLLRPHLDCSANVASLVVDYPSH